MRLNTRAMRFVVGAMAVFAGSLALPAVFHRIAGSGMLRSAPPALLEAAPTIDVIVPAYLEASVVGPKVRGLKESFAEHDTPGRVIVVASDEATARAAARAGADVVIETGRLGKAAAINRGVEHSDAAVIAFTDANCSIEPAGWYGLLCEDLEQSNLVSAQKIEEGGSETGLHLLDQLIRRSSESVHESAAVYGEFVAMRRVDFEPLPEDVILDDVALGLSFGRRQLRVVVDGRIRTVEPAPSAKEHWGRRVRIAEGLLSESVPDLPRLLRFPAGRVFAAHKLVRVTVSCTAFWAAFVVGTAVVPPLSFTIPVIGIVGVLGYSGRVALPRQVSTALAPVGMQAVPVVALLRIIRGRLRTEGRTNGALWKKIER